MAERHYAVLAFQENDRLLLRSIMALLNVRTQHTWSETAAAASAHVVFIDMDSTEGQSAWQRLQDKPRVWCSRETAGDAEYSLELPVKLGTLSPLVVLLEQQVPEDASSQRAGSSAEKPETDDDFPHVRGI